MPFVKHTSEQAAVYKASSRYAHRVGRKFWLPTRPDRCTECGEPPRGEYAPPALRAHHDDYNHPLVVRWLCQRCHRRWHVRFKAIPLADFSLLNQSEREILRAAGIPITRAA